MAFYKDDRSFTNYVHENLALPLIYKKLGWTQKQIDASLLEYIDINEGVDYVFTGKQGEEIKSQERFRRTKYQTYSDCTLRYRRDNNPVVSRHKSEYYKVKADYLVYGITNNDLTGFVKFVVVDLKVLFSKIDNGLITPEYGGNFSRIVNGKMIAVIKDNVDDSSSFVAFDVKQLNQLFGSDNIILFQEGYL